MADFLNSLRMNGIFNQGGGGGNLLGPPDFSGGSSLNAGDIIGQIMQARENAKREDENRQYRMMTFQNDMNRRNKNIDQKEADRRAMFPQNTAVRWPDEEGRNSLRMTDYQKAQAEIAKERNALTARGLDVKDQNSDEDRMIRQQRADTYSGMHDLSDSEKLEIVNRARRGDIEARGMIEAGLLDKRSNAAMDRQNDQQMFLSGMAGVNQQNNLAQIAARVAGEKDVAGYKSTLPGKDNPNFERTGNWNEAQQIINSRPDLAPFVTLGTGGQFNITAPGTNFWGSQTGPSKEQYDELNRIIYGNTLPNAKPGDAKATTLPADKTTPKQAVPLTTPKSNNGSTSKYKVTIQ